MAGCAEATCQEGNPAPNPIPPSSRVHQHHNTQMKVVSVVHCHSGPCALLPPSPLAVTVPAALTCHNLPTHLLQPHSVLSLSLKFPTLVHSTLRRLTLTPRLATWSSWSGRMTRS